MVVPAVVDDRGPVEKWVEFLRGNLQHDKCNQHGQENRRRCEIAQVHRHRNGIATRLTEGCRGDFDDPETECDCRYFRRERLSRHRTSRYRPLEKGARTKQMTAPASFT
jgi:hypothetical protein